MTVTKAESLLAERYALRRPLATGGHARIFEAEDRKLGREVAIKMLPPAFERLPEATERLAREGRIAGGIVHPNVCALLDVGQLPSGAPFLVYERLVGETLATRLEKTTALPVDQAVRIAEQILHGVAAAHARGVVHRDLKPGNVFLVDLVPGVPLVKILDFGTAQVPGDELADGAQLTGTGFVVGTVEYMAPEQVRGLRDFDARTDVYACGVMLYEMLSGARPFAERPKEERLSAIGFEKPRSLVDVAPRVPRAIARAVDQALVTDRDRRLPDAEAFVMALRSPHAPPMTAATNVLSKPAPVAGPPSQRAHEDEWDSMPTRESGPPQSMIPDDSDGDPPPKT